MAIKQRIPLQKAAQYDRSLHESFAKGASYNFSVQRKTAFFCHSHHDRKMVEGFLAYEPVRQTLADLKRDGYIECI